MHQLYRNSMRAPLIMCKYLGMTVRKLACIFAAALQQCTPCVHHDSFLSVSPCRVPFQASSVYLRAYDFQGKFWDIYMCSKMPMSSCRAPFQASSVCQNCRSSFQASMRTKFVHDTNNVSAGVSS
eukprot:1159169-Pelagomonas_calceolata.AAC.6